MTDPLDAFLGCPAPGEAGGRWRRGTRDPADARRPRGLHLWVFDANTGARRFYERHGAQVIDRTVYASADGGANPALCYAWPDAAVLRVP